jgi:hypothetical protein
MHSNPVIASLAQRGAAIQSRQTAGLDCFATLAMTSLAGECDR